MHSPLTKPMNVLCLGSLLSFQAGCLTLDARQSKNDCLNFQECSGLNLRKAGELSENPQKDENDESYELKDFTEWHATKDLRGARLHLMNNRRADGVAALEKLRADLMLYARDAA